MVERFTEARLLLIFDGFRKSTSNKAPPSPPQGEDVRVTHARQRFSSKSGTETAAAVQDNSSILGNLMLFDVSFDDAFAQMKRSFKGTGIEFMLLSNIDNDNVPTIVQHR